RRGWDRNEADVLPPWLLSTLLPAAVRACRQEAMEGPARVALRPAFWHDPGMARLPGIHAHAALAIAALAASAAACRGGSSAAQADGGTDAGAIAQASATAAPEPSPSAKPAVGSDKPLLGITSFVATIYKEPRDTSKKLGYLRVGAKVPRSAEP